MKQTDKYNRELSKHDIDCDLPTKRRKQQLRLGIQSYEFNQHIPQNHRLSKCNFIEYNWKRNEIELIE
jgi:hypothetical protein